MKKLWFGGLLVPALAPGLSYVQTQVKIQKVQAEDKYKLVKDKIKLWNDSIQKLISGQQKIVTHQKLKTEDKIKRITIAIESVKKQKTQLTNELKKLKLTSKSATGEDVVDPDVLKILNDQIITTAVHKEDLSMIPDDLIMLTELNHVDLWRMDSKIMAELDMLDELIESLNTSIQLNKIQLTPAISDKIFKTSLRQIATSKNISDRMISLNTTVIEQNYEKLIEISEPNSNSDVTKFLDANIARMEKEDKANVKLFRESKLGNDQRTVDEINSLIEHLRGQDAAIDQMLTDVINSSGKLYEDLANFVEKFVTKIKKQNFIESLEQYKASIELLYV